MQLRNRGQWEKGHKGCVLFGRHGLSRWRVWEERSAERRKSGMSVKDTGRRNEKLFLASIRDAPISPR